MKFLMLMNPASADGSRLGKDGIEQLRRVLPHILKTWLPTVICARHAPWACQETAAELALRLGIRCNVADFMGDDAQPDARYWARIIRDRYLNHGLGKRGAGNFGTARDYDDAKSHLWHLADYHVLHPIPDGGLGCLVWPPSFTFAMLQLLSISSLVTDKPLNFHVLAFNGTRASIHRVYDPLLNLSQPA